MVLRSLILFTLVGATMGAGAPSPKSVELTTADVPAGYSLLLGLKLDVTLWSERYRLPTSQVTKHGFRSAYDQDFSTKSDVRDVDAAVSQYSTVAGAQWEYKHIISADPELKATISAPSVGMQSVAWRGTGSSARSKPTYDVAFRQGTFDNVIAVTSPQHALTVNDAIHYARLIAKRESHSQPARIAGHETRSSQLHPASSAISVRRVAPTATRPPSLTVARW